MKPQKKLAILGTYLPRQCGIATFTSDLAEALHQELNGEGEVLALAMDDIPEGYCYPERVRFQIRANVQSDYHQAADYITSSRASLFVLQHEFGIFGGPAGAYVLNLIRELRVPVLVTLHTILAEPTPEHRRVMDELWRLSDRLVVMSHRAVQMLQDIYGVPRERIAFIPHGIHDMSFVDPNFYKDRYRAEGRRVILTFGLLSPDKGIENMIEAMPKVVERFPDALYIILGATHPHLKKQFGEAHRISLQRRVADLGLEEHIRFRNRFVELDELCEYLGMADLYVTPYLSEAQITSGTLAYALGSGKAVISTPYWYAQEMLAEDRGVLVPFRDPDVLAQATIRLFDNETERHQMRKRAYQFTRSMVWRQVAREYLALAETVHGERIQGGGPPPLSRKRAARFEELPEPDLRYLHALTDDTGIFQHAVYSMPDRRHGYCTDDIGRALVVCALYTKLYTSNTLDELARMCLAYLSHAFNKEGGRFRNFMDYSRQWLDEAGTDDSNGRALWGLGILSSEGSSENIRRMSAHLFQRAVGAVEGFTSPRAWAFALLGMHAYLERNAGDAAIRRLRESLADKLFNLFSQNVAADWPWCEEVVTYANAALPNALIVTGTAQGNDAVRDQGLRALEWLCEVQHSDRGSNASSPPSGHFSFVGNQGWFPRGGSKALFDQQPIEAMHLCLACAEAYRVTNHERWLSESRRALVWFLGHNDLRAPLYDFSSGGCYDGLTPTGPNLNQGAESTLAWLMALLSFLVQDGRHTLQIESESHELSSPAAKESKPYPAVHQKSQSPAQTT